MNGKKLLYYSACLILLVLTAIACRQPEKDVQIVTEVKTDTLYICENTDVVDSDISFQEAVQGATIPDNILNQLALIDVKYIGYDHQRHRGQILCHRMVAGDLIWIFEKMLSDSFPIEKVVPVVKYNWNDSLSMLDNNTSCFNYRFIGNSHVFSHHARGMAIDINPRQNPCTDHRGAIADSTYGIYDTLQPGTITIHSPIVSHFRSAGWYWGGNWIGNKDYQHFSRYGG